LAKELKPINLCFFDTETTGLDPQKHDIIEVAAVRVTIQPGPEWFKTWNVEKRFEAKVMPAHPFVEPAVARINGFSVEAWKDARSLPEVLVELYDIIHMTILCGSNPFFDYSFVKAGCDALGWEFPRLLSYHKIDVPTLGVKLLLEGKIERIKQVTLAEYFQMKKQEHRAMADVEQCIEQFKELTFPGGLASVGVHSLSGLQQQES
jgi:DNA polymerase III subunit epsilon